MNKYLRFIKDKKYRFNILVSRGFYKTMPDEKFLAKKFKYAFGRKINLDNPKTFNEKLQWIKLYDRKPIYTTLVDKYAVKKYVADIIGDEYIIPTLGVWDRFEDIDFDSLPEQFVLKCNHNSGGLVICKNKKNLDYEASRARINASLKKNYYYSAREWPYKDVRPCILAEKYMEDAGRDFLPVYKIFCFGGNPHIIQTIQNDKQPNESIDYFDTDWNLLNLKQNYPNSEAPLPKPKKLDEMLELAKKLAGNAPPFIRVDFYEVNGKLYFSEFTFFSDAGFAKFDPPEWDIKLGELIKLPGEK